MIASPKVNNSKFSPVVTLGKSPIITKKISTQLSGFSKLKNEKTNILSKFGAKCDTKIVEHEDPFSELDLNSRSSNVSTNTVNVNRKARNVFKNLENLDSSSKKEIKNTDDDLPITEGVKINKKKDGTEYFINFNFKKR
jgi:hypothetical protein